VLRPVAADTSDKMARRRSIVSLGLACGLLAGCGGSTASPPKYLAAANAICAQQVGQLDRLAQPTTLEQTVSYLPRALAIMQRETGGLAALHPVGSSRAQFAAALASARQLAGVLTRFLGQLHTGMVQFATFSQVEAQSNELRAALDAHFRQAGLTRCAD
jgi:hypothetical protein